MVPMEVKLKSESQISDALQIVMNIVMHLKFVISSFSFLHGPTKDLSGCQKIEKKKQIYQAIP
jgi:hypothetical protein